MTTRGKILCGTREEADAIVNTEVENIIDAVTDTIRAKESEGFSEIKFPLQDTWTQTGGIDPGRMRIVIYGKVLDHLLGGADNFKVSLLEETYASGRVQFYLHVQWEPIVSLTDYERYKQIVTKNMRTVTGVMY